MVMKKNQEPLFEGATAPVEMRNSCVAGGKARRVGDIVEVGQKEYFYLTTKGHAIPHLGEPAVKARAKTRGKKGARD